MRSVQNPSILPLYWLGYRDSPFLDYKTIPNILGSVIPELINHQGYLAATAQMVWKISIRDSQGHSSPQSAVLSFQPSYAPLLLPCSGKSYDLMTSIQNGGGSIWINCGSTNLGVTYIVEDSLVITNPDRSHPANLLMPSLSCDSKECKQWDLFIEITEGFDFDSS